ncbi:MAG TPA: hypothetical protein VFB12_22015 [Ktedonobacteraceae bacterium]|nr:hypothetical protein [Ktedonobacteraceae bacterium]
MIDLIGTCGDFSLIEKPESGAIAVILNGPDVDQELLGIACAHAKQSKHVLSFLYALEVPIQLPLNARMEPERLRAEKRLRAALLVASQLACTATAVTIHCRDAGRSLVEEAKHSRFTALFLQAYQQELPDAYKRLVAYLMAKAPCRVLVNSVPAGIQADLWLLAQEQV